MASTKKVNSVLIVIILLIGALAGMITYYNYELDSKNSIIISLQSRISNQSDEIANLTSQISNLNNRLSEITNLTAPRAEITQIIENKGTGQAVVGVATEIVFYVNVTNTGLQDINGSTIIVQNIGTNTLPQGKYSGAGPVPLLSPNGTTRTFVVVVMGISQFEEASSLAYFLVLNFNGTVLDQKTYYSISR
jgi:hypothetical protein